MATIVWSLFALIMLLGSLGLMLSHVRTWRATQDQADSLDPREFDFRRRQFRRRTQTTTMVAVLSLSVLVGPLIESPPLPMLFCVLYWCGMLLLVVWLMGLAAADILATKLHFTRLHEANSFEEAKLKTKLRELKSTQHDERESH